LYRYTAGLKAGVTKTTTTSSSAAAAAADAELGPAIPSSDAIDAEMQSIMQALQKMPSPVVLTWPITVGLYKC
jgi:hypothetical protein